MRRNKNNDAKYCLAVNQHVLVFLDTGKCNPEHFTKKAHPDSDTSYYHCNADGTLAKRDCAQGRVFNKTSLECEFTKKLEETSSAVEAVQLPQFQAPDDICSGGIPLTRLSAPVVCNPTISTCPDGYFCTLHSRTGTSYCCQSIVEPYQESTLCTGNQPMNGLPKSCVLSASSSCPIGFGCNLVGGSFTRCCGRNFGCPVNSAGYVNPTTGAYVQCNKADPTSCPSGFMCTQSSMFNTGICCSDTSSSPTDVCGGDNPLSKPNPCSASSPCPAGFSCRNGRCCPARGLCPAGTPLGGVTSCSNSNPCPNNYQCVTSNAQQYCCPAPEHVCGQSRDAGVPCETRVTAVSRYYFDSTTGSCRAFQFSQCGGNANNFDTLEQCEGFCLESQCPQGTGLRAGPSVATCSAAQALGDLTSIGTPDTTCPAHYSCVQPLFGSNFICCTSSEHVCRDAVTAGTSCFGAFLTIQRFHYNVDRGQCEPFQYYGCNGSGNNFVTKRQCEAACQPQVKSACNGVAPLNDEGDYVQRCSENVPCPRGSWCNTRGYCCPHTETACQSPRSIGHTCLSQRPGTYWYFDTSTETCLPFAYSGCGGTSNRFADREACEQMCINKLGECPRGMAPFLTPAGTKQCAINVAGSCPEGSSCVRSNLGEPICCTSTAQCPLVDLHMLFLVNLKVIAYLNLFSTGSDSNVACIPDDDNCPQGYQCLQSNNVPGFYMCCTGHARRMSAVAAAARRSSVNARPKGMMASLLAAAGASSLSRYAAAAAAPKCPSGLHSNGQRCTVNEIEGCPHGYVCLGGESIRGVCCKASPKCRKKKKPYYVGKKQVLTCGDDEAGCPRGSSCIASSIEGVDICCMSKGGSTHSGSSSTHSSSSSSSTHSTFSKVPKVVPKCKDGALPFFALGSRVPQQCTADRDDECPEEYECDQASDENNYCCPAWDRCPNNASPFLVEGSRKPLGCNWMANNCPEGYSCEGSKDRAICCRSRPTSAQCPTGRSPFLYAKRPLVCPPGKKSCPSGYDCVTSRGNIHICCSTIEHQAPECVNGYAYFDPATSKNQLCDPAMDSCPTGYRCKRSTMANAHVCCTILMDNRYDGMNGLDGSPPTCHMAIKPCPTTAAYQCIYSAEKQGSYCCAPVDTTSAATRTNYRAFPPNRRAPMNNNNLNAYNQQQHQQQQYQLQLQYQQQRGVANNNINANNNQQQQQLPNYGSGGMGPVPETGCGGTAGTTEMMLPLPESNGMDNTAGGYAGNIYGGAGGLNPYANQASAAQQQFMASIMNGAGSSMSNNGGAGAMQQSNAMMPAAQTVTAGENGVPNIFVASCPPWSKSKHSWGTSTGGGPTQQPHFSPEMASESPSSNTTSLQYAPTKEAASNMTSTNTTTASLQCPQEWSILLELAKEVVFFVGQQGCDTDSQCTQRTNGTRCYKRYCSCEEGRLIHESKCVVQCPEGFLNIAGRCHDLTTIVFMDSVEERENGTLGGYCKDTVVMEEQCVVENAYCNERSITCQCKPGFELHMDFENKDDKGLCQKVEGSKFEKTDSKKSEQRLLDQVFDEVDEMQVVLDETAQSPQTFYAIESNDSTGSETDVTTSTTTGPAPTSEMKTEKPVNTVRSQPLNDTMTIFFQSDDQ
uniref:Papilin n=1 Tax=Ditylenchus dipsaci TaxID=166011 RepID=A0A915CN95_9BILA